MRPALFVGFAASLVAAQDQLGDIPSCARDCVSKYVTGNGVAGCKTADIVCVCKNDDFLNNIACCLAGACNSDDQAKTVKFAAQICKAASVPVPSEVVCKKGTSSSATTAAATATNAAAKATSTTATGRSAPSSTGAAAPVLGGVAGAVLAMLAAL